MKRHLWALAALSLTAAACTGTATPPGTTVAGPARTAPATSVTVVVPAGDEAVVTRVFDGDSFEAEIDGREVEVRMLGINAPERDECHGDVARGRLRDLIEDASVTLVDDGEDTDDRFGRLLRSVYTTDSFVNATMVAEGHALALQSGDPQESRLVELSAAAYDAQLGMWAPDACDDTNLPDIRIVEIEYDPPGRDFENKTEEWVVVRNIGETPVDLGGWIIRDESSTHRYEFPAGENLPAGDELRIRTGCGDDRRSDRYWCADDAVWSNGGDTVILQTAAGTVIDRALYEGDF